MADTYLSNAQFTVTDDVDFLSDDPVKVVWGPDGMMVARLTPDEFAAQYTLVQPPSEG